MRHVILTAIIAVFSVMNVFARPASINPADCVPVLDNLFSVTSTASSLTAKEQQGLLKIVTASKTYYLQGKTSDALNKLQNYSVKLDQLDATLATPNPKISEEDSQSFRAALNEVIACISGS